MPRSAHGAAFPPLTITPTLADWRKWTPGEPTSPHWYSQEHFNGLIGAYLRRERDGAKARTVREFVGEFAGLAGSAKQKTVAVAVAEPAALGFATSSSEAALPPLPELVAPPVAAVPPPRPALVEPPLVAGAAPPAPPAPGPLPSGLGFALLQAASQPAAPIIRIAQGNLYMPAPCDW